MTASTRRAMPWLVSLGTHAAALAAVAVALALSPHSIRPVMDVLLVGGSGSRGAQLPARAGLRAGPPDREALPQQPSARSGMPATARGVPRSAVAAGGSKGPVPSSPDIWSLNASRTGALPGSATPSAGDVLNDTESAAAQAGAPDAVGTPDSRASAAAGGAPGGQASTATEWGWQGLPRRLMHRINPEFPTLLSQQGQEVEVEARITVAPSGMVTRVEITRGSGYIEIDANVADALRGYLFSRVDGREDSTGTVKFRFRLEKQD